MYDRRRSRRFCQHAGRARPCLRSLIIRFNDGNKNQVDDENDSGVSVDNLFSVKKPKQPEIGELRTELRTFLKAECKIQSSQ